MTNIAQTLRALAANMRQGVGSNFYSTRAEAVRAEIVEPIAAARDLLIAEGYAPEDVETSLANLENEGLENPRQDVDNSWDQVLEDAEIQTVREQIVSERAVTIADITAALDMAGIEYAVKHRGTLNASVHVGDLAMGPCALDQDGNGLGVNTYADGDGHDWHATVADAVERAAKYADNIRRVDSGTMRGEN